MRIGKGLVRRSLLGVVVSVSVVLGCGSNPVSAAASSTTTDNVCNGPVLVNETLTVRRDPATHTKYGVAVFSSPGGLSESYQYSYVVESAHEWSGTIILVDDDPIQKADTLLHVSGEVYFSEGGYVSWIRGSRFNICKVFGDRGSTRL
jgi:hypothetical protein